MPFPGLQASNLPWSQHPSAFLHGVQLVLEEMPLSPPKLNRSLLFHSDTRSEVHLQTEEGVEISQKPPVFGAGFFPGTSLDLKCQLWADEC